MAKRPTKRPTKRPNKDAEMYVEANIAAILTPASMPQTVGGHTTETVVRRYKEILRELRASTKELWRP